MRCFNNELDFIERKKLLKIIQVIKNNENNKNNCFPTLKWKLAKRNHVHANEIVSLVFVVYEKISIF